VEITDTASNSLEERSPGMGSHRTAIMLATALHFSFVVILLIYCHQRLRISGPSGAIRMLLQSQKVFKISQGSVATWQNVFQVRRVFLLKLRRYYDLLLN